ncbi:N-acetyltransferase, partial [Streptomyces oryzae]|nr:N-acetyltransferase [Streptomyces oryzae]
EWECPRTGERYAEHAEHAEEGAPGAAGPAVTLREAPPMK